MSDPVLGPGPSALYQTGQAVPVQRPTCFGRDARGSSIHQKTLTDSTIAEISKDPFNILPAYQLVKTILKLSGKLRLTGQESAADASTRFKESRLLSFTHREPAFLGIITKALDNPRVAPAIRPAILQDNPELLPVNKRIIVQECRELVSLIRPEIQAVKDVNLIKFFNQLPKNTTYRWERGTLNNIEPGKLPNFSALSVDPLRHQAAAIRKWMAEHQDLLWRFTGLDLTDADLEIIPQELSRFCNLLYLHLDGNRLSNLPDSFRSFEQLFILSLNRNQFSKFPEMLFQFKYLKTLRFEDNRLESIPEPSSLTGLRRIDFAGNRLTRLPQKVYDLRHLTSLELSRNPDFDQGHFPCEFTITNGQIEKTAKYKFSTPHVDLFIHIKDTALAKRLFEGPKSTTKPSSSSSSGTKRKREAEPLG